MHSPPVGERSYSQNSPNDIQPDEIHGWVWKKEIFGNIKDVIEEPNHPCLEFV